MKTFKEFVEEDLQEVSKSTLSSYIDKADKEAGELDIAAKQEKDPLKKLKMITKASKRGLGAFKAHLKVRKKD